MVFPNYVLLGMLSCRCLMNHCGLYSTHHTRSYSVVVRETNRISSYFLSFFGFSLFFFGFGLGFFLTINFSHAPPSQLEHLQEVLNSVYYDLETCKNKVGEYLLSYPDIKNHYLDLSIVSNELCKIDVLFPPNGLWVEYYNVKDLRDLMDITNKKKKMGVIL